MWEARGSKQHIGRDSVSRAHVHLFQVQSQNQIAVSHPAECVSYRLRGFSEVTKIEISNFRRDQLFPVSEHAFSIDIPPAIVIISLITSHA